MRTDKLLLIGMALTSDKAERRIRGVFSKTRTSALARIALIVLSLCLLLLCFTSACQPKVIDELVERGGGVLPAVQDSTAQDSVTPSDAAAATVEGEKKLSIYVDYTIKRSTPGIAVSILKSIKEKYPDHEVTFYDPSGGDSTMSLNDQMTRLNSDLLVGKGPDVLIAWVGMLSGSVQNGADSFEDIAVGDLGKQILSGAYADIAPFIENDTEFSREDCFEKVLDCISVDSKLFAMPILFYYNGALTCGDALKASGVELSPDDDADALLTKLETYLSEGGEQVFDYPNIAASLMLESVAVEMIDCLNSSFDLDLDIIKRAADLGKRELEIGKAHSYMSDADLGVEALTKGKYLLSNFGRHTGLTMSYATAYETKGGATYIPFRDKNGNTSATVSYYGLIPAGAKDKQMAYDCMMLAIRAILSESDCTSYGIPIIREYARQRLNPESTVPFTDYNEAYGIKNEVATLPQEFFDKYLALADEIGCVELSATPIDIIYNALEPYINGEKDFNECIDEAEYNLMLFLSE